METITDKDLKSHGIQAFEDVLKKRRAAFVRSNGRDAYVVVRIEDYADMRKAEFLHQAHEVRADYEAGRFNIESVEDHVKRITDGPDEPGLR